MCVLPFECPNIGNEYAEAEEKGKVTNTFEFVEIYAIQQAALMCSKD